MTWAPPFVGLRVRNERHPGVLCEEEYKPDTY